MASTTIRRALSWLLQPDDPRRPGQNGYSLLSEHTSRARNGESNGDVMSLLPMVPDAPDIRSRKTRNSLEQDTDDDDSPFEEETDGPTMSGSLDRVKTVQKAEDVAVEVISTEDDSALPVLTFRTVFLGVGLSVFGSVLATIYTFKPQNASVSGLFCLIIAYVMGSAMATFFPNKGAWRYLNPGPFNIKEHTAIVIMASTASTVAVATEVIAALDLFYGIRLSAIVAILQIFASQMIGYGIAGLLRNLLVYPTYAFYPGCISVVNLLQSLHFGGALNHKKRRYFWLVFAAIFCWEWIPQYPFPLLTAISVVCLMDNGRSTYIRNLFGGGSSNEGLGLFSFSTSWSLIAQGAPFVLPLQTQINTYIGMALGYVILSSVYYFNIFNARSLVFMSTSLFGSDGGRYNQSAILTEGLRLDPTKLAQIGLPRYTATYALSQLVYNLSLGAAITHIVLWNWQDLKQAFAGLGFSDAKQVIDDPHYKVMQKYPEVPQWWYLSLLAVSLSVGIICSYTTSQPLMPWWSILLFTFLSAFIAIFLGFISATTGFSIAIRYAVQILAAFVHPGQPIAVMYVNLYGNSTANQCLTLLGDLKLGQYTKLPPRWTLAAQLAGSFIGSIFNYAMMISIVTNNREVLLDPVGTRVWSGWIVQQYNSGSVAMGALGKELFFVGQPYWPVTLAIFMGFLVPIPFWIAHRLAPEHSPLAKFMAYVNTPIICLYIGFLPYSVNGQWWTCLVIGLASQWWARTRRPEWFKNYNYLTSAALDGGSQAMLFILSFAVFGASSNAVTFPNWWGNPADLSVDRCAATE